MTSPKTRRARVTVLTVLLAGGAALYGALGYAAPQATSAQAQYAPESTAPPFITDLTPVEGQTLTANTGTWANSPTEITLVWQRCTANMSRCDAIQGATATTYRLVAADLGQRLRVSVTARNASGSTTVASGPTDPVVRTSPANQVRVAGGETSIPATEVRQGGQRLVITQVRFSPNPIRSRLSPITVQVKVKDTRGFVVRDAAVFVRTTPLVTTTPGEARTATDGWATVQVLPRENFSLVFRRGYNLQFFVRARKVGDNALAGVSARRLVQVPISPGS